MKRWKKLCFWGKVDYKMRRKGHIIVVKLNKTIRRGRSMNNLIRVVKFYRIQYNKRVLKPIHYTVAKMSP